MVETSAGHHLRYHQSRQRHGTIVDLHLLRRLGEIHAVVATVVDGAVPRVAEAGVEVEEDEESDESAQKATAACITIIILHGV